MNTREDLLKWLDDNRAFKDPERKALSSSIVRTLNKNENIKKDFKRITQLDSDNSTELIYNVVFPNQARVCEVCGKPVKFSAYYLGYKKTCSLSCVGKSASQKGAPVKLEKYGSINNRKKVEETKLEGRGESSKKKYVYEGMSFDSSWELAFYILGCLGRRKLFLHRCSSKHTVSLKVPTRH